jgi:hypothetical protein
MKVATTRSYTGGCHIHPVLYGVRWSGGAGGAGVD